jgi:soluble lytic murein transglycosylase-like protein
MRRRYVWTDPMPLALVASTLAFALAMSGAFGIGLSSEARGTRGRSWTASLRHPANHNRGAIRQREPRSPSRSVAVSLHTAIARIARRDGVAATVLQRVTGYAPLARHVWPASPALLLAVTVVESAGDPRAVTEDAPGDFDIGLMQVNTRNFAATGLTWDTALAALPSLRAGTAILRADIARYGVNEGIEAYNAGPGGVGKDEA